MNLALYTFLLLSSLLGETINPLGISAGTAMALGIILLLTSWLLFSYLTDRRPFTRPKNHEQLKAYIEGQEHERARQAMELHDGVGCLLSAAKMHAEALQHDISGLNENIAYIKTLSLIEKSLKEVRCISHNLSPEVVLNGGLRQAIEWYCEQIEHPNLTVRCYILEPLPRLKKNLELTIYRIVQEAITNVIKHAKATNIIVQLSYTGKHMSITIEDDGIGYNNAFNKIMGLGRNNLSTRVSALNGTCEISSGAGAGTSIHIEFAPEQSSISALSFPYL